MKAITTDCGADHYNFLIAYNAIFLQVDRQTCH